MNSDFIRKNLVSLFESVDDTFIKDLMDTAEIITYETGDYILRQGGIEKEMFVVLTGRIRIIKEDIKGHTILGDVGAGQPVGEFSFFSNEPRIASGIAMRKTSVLKLTENDYLNLIRSYPHIAQKFSAFVYNRLQSNQAGIKKNTALKNFSVILLNEINNYEQLIEQVLTELSTEEITTEVYTNLSVDGNDIASTLNKIDEHEGINFLVCDQTDMNWSRHCLMYSDAIIIATNFTAEKTLYPIEKELDLYNQNILNQSKYLLLIHPDNDNLPKNTKDWLEPRTVDLHIHLRRDQPKDLSRFCRIITNRATGLVLGGGGAKGFAHVGAIKAILEAGIEIDFVGGTSAGAIYGVGMGYIDFNYTKAYEISILSGKMKALSTQFTIPIISLLSSKKLTKFLREIFGDTYMEDIWYNTYCVSTNFSDSSLHVHTSGVAWKQISASMALPGIFPPVIINKKIHIDGGVMDNLPIEVMYKYPVSKIIAIALSSIDTVDVNIDEVPSTWTLLWDKIRGQNKFDLPGIPTILVSSGMINSWQRQKKMNKEVNMYVELDLKGFSMLDGSKWKEMIEMGYQQMTAFLKNNH